MGISYKDAGVDISAGEEVVSRIKKDVKSTFGPEVLTGLGSFGALFAPDLANYQEPVLVSGTDGVGTKLKIAFMMDQHDTVGIDLVAMCVNDVLAQGARPLFFLDYIATGKIDSARVAAIVKGITAGCKQAGCALIGGETAEMPDFYDRGEYDMAGFTVGLVDREKVITGEKVKPGDKIIGLGSNGIHSNGYSLVRKVLFEVANYGIKEKLDSLKVILGEELLRPTRIYVKPVLEILKEFDVKGIAHITGGGLTENIPRVLPSALSAVLAKDNWPVQSIFDLIQAAGEIEENEMYRTFNMGIGMVLIVPETDTNEILNRLSELGEKAYLIGEITEGSESEKAIEFR